MFSLFSPNATRPWQYILEPLCGYLLLGSKMYKDGVKYNSAWNFGPNDENIITVNELFKLIIKNWGSGDVKVDTSSQPHEAGLLKLKSMIKILMNYPRKLKLTTIQNFI